MSIPIPLIGAGIIGRAPFGYFPATSPTPQPGAGMDGVDPPIHPEARAARIVRRDNGREAGPELVMVEGQARESAWELTFSGVNSRGEPIPSPYPGTAALSAQIHQLAPPGPLIIVPRVVWLDPGTGSALLVVRPSQVARLAIGTYSLSVDVISGGISTRAVSTRLSILPRPVIPPETP